MGKMHLLGMTFIFALIVYQVLTIFSCSNYYAIGSNYGAYIQLGSDLKPFPVQFSVSREPRTLSLQQRVGVNEASALRELREQFFCRRDELLRAFKRYDQEESGVIKPQQWVECVESVLRLKIPWTMLRHKFVQSNDKGDVYYMTCLEGYQFSSSLPQQLRSISETLYRNRNSLETVFRLIDKDCSGLITLDEFQEACEVLNKHSKIKVSKDDIDTLGRTLDINKDGMIDFNEFLEAFRLVSLSFGDCSENSYHDLKSSVPSKESMRNSEGVSNKV